MCKSGICDTKLSDMSETKQSIAKVTTQCLQKFVYGQSIGDKSGDLQRGLWPTFPGETFLPNG